MTNENPNPLLGETLLTIDEAANDFGGVPISTQTVSKYIYKGYKGLKLESILINRRYTSKEAILRFIERKQNPHQPVPETKRPRMTQAQVDASLRRHGIIK